MSTLLKQNVIKNILILLLLLNASVAIAAAPVVTSTAITQATEDIAYSYNLEATDADGDTPIWGGSAYPSWLSMESNRTTEIIAGHLGSDIADSSGVLAIDAYLRNPKSIVLDSTGNIYFTDSGNDCIRKIDKATGKISTVAGTFNSAGFSGDGELATAAQLNYPDVITVDNNGNLYISDWSNERVRMVPKVSGTYFNIAMTADYIYTIAGTGTTGSANEIGVATSADLNRPGGLLVDINGDLYLADVNNHVVRKIDFSSGNISTVVGTFGVAGDSGNSLNGPSAIIFDADDNMIIAQKGNNKISRVDKDTHVITTIAGTGVAGATGDGVLATTATLNSPGPIVMDSSGNIYVAEYGNHAIRKIDAVTGYITTIAGTLGTSGSTNTGDAKTSLFFRTTGIAIDSDENVYIGDYSQVIRKISITSTTLYGTPENEDVGVYDINLSVRDQTSSTPHNFQLTVANVNDIPSSADLNATIDEDNSKVFALSDFNFTDDDTIHGDTLDAIYITTLQSDGNLTLNGNEVTLNQKIESADIANLTFTPFANASGTPYATFGFKVSDGEANSTSAYTATINVNPTNDAPTFTNTASETVTENSVYTYTPTVSDNEGDLTSITAASLPHWLSFSSESEVSTFAGSGSKGFTDATGTAASFYAPYGVAVDSNNNIYVADEASIRKITPDGEVTIFAGNRWGGYVDATGTTARFGTIKGIAIDSHDNIFVADTGNNRIRKITPAGVVTTFAGGETYGNTDGTGTAARFKSPEGIAIDSNDNIYVADTRNYKIRKITPSRVVTTFAGSGSVGSVDATGTSASFRLPKDVAVDSSGNIYVADHSDNRIRKITPARVVTTFAGGGITTSTQVGHVGSEDGTGIEARFYYPDGIAIDSSDTIYVADTRNNKIRKITLDGVVTTFSGSGDRGDTDDVAMLSSFYYPKGIALDSNGNLYVADFYNYKIRKISQSQTSLSGTPTASGVYDVNLTVTDGDLNTTLNYQIVVGDINDAPVLNDYAFVVGENNATLSSVGVVTAFDEDDNAFTYSIQSGNTNSDFTIDSTTGEITIAKELNAYVTQNYVLTVKAQDDGGASDSATVSIAVSDEVDAPVAVADTNTTNEDQALTVNIISNDTDKDNNLNPASIIMVQNPFAGTVKANGDGTITYTPYTNYYGSDYFTYKVYDDTSLVSNEVNVTLTINAVNDAPVATSATVNTDEDINVDIFLDEYVSDVDGDNLTYTIESNPSHGTAVINDGVVTYDPDLNFYGFDSFTYKANDGTVDSETKTISINVSEINDVPVANNDYDNNTTEDNAININVLANDTDDEMPLDVATVEILNAPTHGTAVPQGDGTITYTPEANWYGQDVFEYTVKDTGLKTGTQSGAGVLISNGAFVTVNVSSVNDTPTANNDSFILDEDSIYLMNLDANDTDVDGDLNGTAITIVTQPSHGTATLTSSGLVRYIPTKDYSGDDSFTYKISDGDVNSSEATVSLTINAVNDAPSFITSREQNISENSTATIVTLSAQDVEDNTPLSYSIVSGKDSAFFTLSGADLSFVTARDYENPEDADTNNTYSVDINLTDSVGGSFVKTFDVTVVDISEASFSNDGGGDSVSVTPNENQTAVTTITTSGLSGVLTYTLDGVDKDSFSIDSNGVLTFQSSPDYETKSTYTVTVTVSNGSDTITQTITVNVADVNEGNINEGNINEAPIVTSTPTTSVFVDEKYLYSLVATDNENDILTWNALPMPNWLTFQGIKEQLIFAGTTAPTTDAGNYDTPDGTDANISKLIIGDISSNGEKVFFSDKEEFGIRYVDSNGKIQTFLAGNGLNTTLNPTGIAYDDTTNTVYIADYSKHSIYKSINGGALELVGAARSVRWYVQALLLDKSNNKLYASTRSTIYEIDLGNNNSIRKIVGNGASFGSYLDTGVASTSLVKEPKGLAFDSNHNLVFTDSGNHIIRRIDIANDTIETIAGIQGNNIISGDGGLATAATFNAPSGLAIDNKGRIFVAERISKKIRVINTDGTIENFANISATGFLNSLVISETGELYIATDYQILQLTTNPNIYGTPSVGDIGMHDVNITVTDGTTTVAHNFQITVSSRDTDGDGTPDATDTDDDSDGILDTLEGNGDADKDGTPNSKDTDSDNNGILDSTEGNIDTDSDGIPNYQDIDDDNDGISDIVEGNGDDDNDGTPNLQDTDSDNDGTPDNQDQDSIGNRDTDGDGIPDYQDTDDDNDGITDIVEGNGDADNDGKPNSTDTDSDNDGTPDNQDVDSIGNRDTDSDGTPDATDTDDDNDGIADTVEGNGDADNDGIPNSTDTDSDNDSIPDSTEGSTDSDNDGIIDSQDNDSDNDGTPDNQDQDSIGSRDTDSDGTPDYSDTDDDNDGIADTVEGNGDADNDGMPNSTDTDSDNDSIPDSTEGSTDSDNDGIIDSQDNDSDNDGTPDNQDQDSIGNRDTDSDNTPDYSDTDDDNDNIPDATEGNGDADNDGIPNSQDTDSDNDGIPDVTEGSSDTDSDGIPDYIDTDSDNDGTLDIDEGTTDADSDGILDSKDSDSKGSLDTDGDGIVDAIDTDDDNDNISDITEGNGDTDGDGLPNSKDTDSDGDNIPDVTEGTTDSDSDGIPDSQDTDSDNDGIQDNQDQDSIGNKDTDSDGTPDYSDTDDDNDGIDDTTEGNGDADNDGLPNSQDTDSDNDGIPDATEGSSDTDSDGIIDSQDSDSDNDGTPDNQDQDSIGNKDTDSDGTPDYSDTDDDNDGIDDTTEGNGDTDNDGIPNSQDTDSDNDGIPDVTEGSSDTDSDGIPDYIDTDSDNDGTPDIDEDPVSAKDNTSTGTKDTDSDGTSDPIDTDDDNDTITDTTEGNGDADNDATPNYKDTDSDNDGIEDGVEGNVDTDSDGIPDYIDTDSDNDGTLDIDEDPVSAKDNTSTGTKDTDSDGTPDPIDTDDDNDGFSDILEGNIDIDNDGIPDFKDTDSDNDGTLDIDEDSASRIDNTSAGTKDTDGDGTLNATDPDDDNDGINDTTEGNGDADNDGIPNSQDTDSDNDGIPDATEGSSDTDSDGIIDSQDSDSDNDGISDLVEGASDSDGDGILDYKDITLITDLKEYYVVLNNSDLVFDINVTTNSVNVASIAITPQSSSNLVQSALVPVEIASLGTMKQMRLSFTPRPNVVGLENITVTTTDGVDTINETFEIRVAGVIQQSTVASNGPLGDTPVGGQETTTNEFYDEFGTLYESNITSPSNYTANSDGNITIQAGVNNGTKINITTDSYESNVSYHTGGSEKAKVSVKNPYTNYNFQTNGTLNIVSNATNDNDEKVVTTISLQAPDANVTTAVSVNGTTTRTKFNVLDTNTTVDENGNVVVVGRSTVGGDDIKYSSSSRDDGSQIFTLTNLTTPNTTRVFVATVGSYTIVDANGTIYNEAYFSEGGSDYKTETTILPNGSIDSQEYEKTSSNPDVWSTTGTSSIGVAGTYGTLNINGRQIVSSNPSNDATSYDVSVIDSAGTVHTTSLRSTSAFGVTITSNADGSMGATSQDASGNVISAQTEFNGQTKHTITVSGVVTEATSKIEGATTTLLDSGVVTTLNNATSGLGIDMNVTARSDGTAAHYLQSGTSIVQASSKITGALTLIKKDTNDKPLIVTSVSTLNDLNQRVDLEVTAKSDVTAVHKMSFTDENNNLRVVQANFNTAGAITEIKTDGSIETNSTQLIGDINATLKAIATRDGKASHYVSYIDPNNALRTIETRAISEIRGGTTTVSSSGVLETNITSESDTTLKAVVKTYVNGASEITFVKNSLVTPVFTGLTKLAPDSNITIKADGANIKVESIAPLIDNLKF